MSVAKTEQAVTSLVEAHVLGKRVEGLRVLGVNSLKSLESDLDTLRGQAVVSFLLSEGLLTLALERARLSIDLQRTGGLELLPKVQAWTPTPGAVMPTGRLAFADGTGIDFREPSRTKRITFRVVALDRS